MHFDLPVLTHARVDKVEHVGELFRATTGDGRTFAARNVIAATGGFSTPYRPTLPGQPEYRGNILHTHEYHRPEPFEGQRVIVVGSGNSAVQVAAELASVARVTLTSRAPLRFRRQRFLGHDCHFWVKLTRVPPQPGNGHRPARSVRPRPEGVDRMGQCPGRGRPDHRPLFRTLVDVASCGKTVPSSAWTLLCWRRATARALRICLVLGLSRPRGHRCTAWEPVSPSAGCTTSARRFSAVSPRPPYAVWVLTLSTSFD
jgi:Pyridine nucleotide-disulphide oxidoreductase